MRRIFTVFFVLAMLAGTAFGGIMGWAKLKASQIELTSLDAAGSSVVLAGDGKAIGRIASAEAGKALEDKQVSTLIRHAHLAAEDRGFYTHGAISLKGMAWAMMTNAREGTLAAGGSTITQQYAKQFAGTHKTVDRKLDELPYAYKLENEFSKDEIIVKYVNANYYGRGAYGIEDAAQTWFGVSATKLKDMGDPLQVARAAFLASLIKQPSVYDDYDGKPSNLKNAKSIRERTIYVLDGLREVKGTPSLVAQDVINQAKALLVSDLSSLKITNKLKATGSAVEGDPFIMQYVQDWIVAWQTEIAKQDGLDDVEARKRGQSVTETMLARGGLKIQTDLDRGAQTRVVSAHKDKLGGGPSGVVILNPRTGGIAAMSGGRNYRSDPYNYAIYGNRPPGSTMKAFVLADAVSQGISPKSVFAAPGQIRIDGPPITDHGGRDASGCKMTLADSLAVSHNVVAVEAATGKMASCANRKKLTKIDDYPVTPKSVATLIRKAGADASPVPGRDAPTKIGEEPRLAIGASLELSPLKLAVMASTLANGGEYHKPYLIRRIDAPGDENMFEHEDESERVIEEEEANIVNQVLTGVFTRGTARGAQVEGHPLAGKTGTTDEEQGDAWGFAYNAVNPKQKKEPAYVFAGWGGKNSNRAGADVMEIAQAFFSGMLNGRPTVNFPDADLDAGKLVGLNAKADEPPPPPVTTTQPEPTKSDPPPPPTSASPDPTTEPTKPEPSPSASKPSRSVPPPENGGVNTGVVEVPGLPVG